MAKTLDKSYDELVFKAQNLFWIEGYKGVNAKELADHLEVSTSTIYNKYSKEMLFLGSLEYYINTYSDPFLSGLRTSTGGIESLREFFYSLVDALLDKTFPRSCLMVNTVVELRNENQAIVDIYERYLGALVQSYNVVLNKAIELGQIKHPEKKKEYVDYILGLIFSLSVLYKIKDKQDLLLYIDEELSLIS